MQPIPPGDTWHEHAAAPASAARPEPAGLEVREHLGAGAMGEVWRVYDPKLDRTLAMKVLRAELSTQAALVDRFVREARVTAGLEHRGVAPVHGLGRLPDGRPYYTMKELAGRTFAQELCEGGDPVRAAGWVAEVADALACAHARGVVHRDVKPENVLIGPLGEVTLLDWGLARSGVGEDGAGQTVGGPPSGGGTRVGAVMGTPGYMSPEQAAGESAGPATDVFALGVVLGRVLAQLPEGGRGLDELAERMRAQEPGRRPGAGEVRDALTAWVSEARAQEQGRARAERAEELVAALDAEGARVARELFVRLADRHGAARSLPEAELRGLHPRAAALVSALVEADALEARGGEVAWADASLPAYWRRLAGYLAAEGPGLALRERLTSAAGTWADGRHADRLWRGALLAEATAWQRRADPLLAADEEAFLAAGRRQEARVARRLRGAVAAAFGALALVGVALAALWLDARASRREAERARDQAAQGEEAAQRALASALMERATRLLADGDRAEAATFAAGALGLVDDPAARGVLAQVLATPAPTVQGGWAVPGGCRRVRVAPDGSWLACAAGPQVQAWARDGAPKWSWTQEGHDWVSLSVSADGAQVAVGGKDGEVCALRAGDGARVWCRRWDGARFWSIRHLGDQLVATGEWPAGGASPARAVILRSADGADAGALKLPDTGFSLDARADGAELAIAAGGFVTIWEAARGVERARYGPFTNGALGVSWSPDGTTLAVGTGDAAVLLLDRASGAARELGRHGGIVPEVAWSPDGRLLLSGSEDGTVRLWEPRAGRELARLPGHSGWWATAAFAPDGASVWTGSRDETLRVWSTAPLAAVPAPIALEDNVRGVLPLPDGSVVVAARGLRWIDPRGLAGPERRWEGRMPLDVHLVDDGLFAHCAPGLGVTLARGPALEVLASREAPLADSRGVAVVGDRRVWLGDGGSWVVEARDTGAVLFRGGLGAPGVAVRAGSDGLVTLIDGRGRVARLDPVTGEARTLFDLRLEATELAALSPDGRWLAIESTRGGRSALLLASVPEGVVVRTLESGGTTLGALAFSRDGRLLVRGGWDQQVRAFEVESGAERLRFAGTDRIVALAADPDGAGLWVGQWDGRVERVELGPATADAAALRARVAAQSWLALDGVEVVAAAPD